MRVIDRRATRLARVKQGRGIAALNKVFGWTDEPVVREPVVGRQKRRERNRVARASRKRNRS